MANRAGFPVHSDDVIAIERALLFGTTAPEALQAAWHTPGQIGWIDIALSAVYVAHFVLPLAVAFGFWVYDRPLFMRYVVTLLGMSLVQFAIALLLPVAPPRFAGEYGSETLAVIDIPASVATVYRAEAVSWAYQHMIGNPVAAFPSLHAAYPVLAALFIAERSRRLAVVMAGYSLVVWVSIMYTGHHYLVDAIGGAALAAVAYAVSLWAARRASAAEARG